MPKPETYRRLAEKLRRGRSGVLTNVEVTLVAAELMRLLGPGVADLSQRLGIRPQDGIRWSSLKSRCEEARGERGLSLKDAAAALKVPRYRLAAVEGGTLSALKPDIAGRYWRFLGIESWVKRWIRANPRLARRAGIVQESRGRGDLGGDKQSEKRREAAAAARHRARTPR
jgi:hypothetical protein